MNIPFFYMMDVVLMTRLLFQFREVPVSAAKAGLKCIIELAFLVLFAPGLWLLILAAGIVLINISTYFLEKNASGFSLKRIITLFLYFIFFSTIFSPVFRITLNQIVLLFLANWGDFQLVIAYLTSIPWYAVLAVFSGALLCLNEVNHFIRYFFRILNLAPRNERKKTAGVIDLKEYNRGRIIGMLERLLIYAFVLTAQYTAIGFVLTAKGITRFKELQERSFAEYFLIGTLLSTIAAGGIALIIQTIL